MMTRILITGADGFIGKHVVRELKNSGYDLNLMIHHNPSDELKNLLSNSDFIYVGDIKETVKNDDSFKNVDVVVHLAANTNITTAIQNPILDFNASAATVTLLDAMNKNNVTKFLFLSGGRVYGIPQYSPVDENHPLNPDEPYGAGKLIGEVYAKLYARSGIKSTILRAYTIYGPGLFSVTGSNSRVVARFTEKLLKGEPITIFGNGSLQRNFMYVADLSWLIKEIIKRELWGETMNVASDNQTTIKELAEILAAKLGKPLKIEYKDHIPGDFDQYPSIERLRSKMSDMKFTLLEEGLDKYIASITTR